MKMKISLFCFLNVVLVTAITNLESYVFLKSLVQDSGTNNTVDNLVIRDSNGQYIILGTYDFRNRVVQLNSPDDVLISQLHELGLVYNPSNNYVGVYHGLRYEQGSVEQDQFSFERAAELARDIEYMGQLRRASHSITSNPTDESHHSTISQPNNLERIDYLDNFQYLGSE